jgi:2,3-diketo-5-methylthio-1-phosphopentane phosphatase
VVTLIRKGFVRLGQSGGDKKGGGRMHCRIICDFDGTIALEDVTDVLLERFALPEWQSIEQQWKSGEIGSRECMSRQVDLLRATPRELDDCLDAVAIDPHFPAFAALARRLGCELLVVSDGLDHAIHRVLSRFGLGHLPIRANRLQSTGADTWRLGFPHASDGCAKGAGTCKCRIAGDHDRVLRLLIGDGASDFCAAAAVHMVFAKRRLIAHCRDSGLPHVPFADFAEAARLLCRLLEAPAGAATLSTLELTTE